MESNLIYKNIRLDLIRYNEKKNQFYLLQNWSTVVYMLWFGDLRQYPLDTGCKLNVHKTFRRSHGRHLNVLSTFNLRPVSNWYYCKQ